MSETLLPCPFCGSEAMTWGPDLPGELFVSCSNPQCAGHTACDRPEHWNRRDDAALSRARAEERERAARIARNRYKFWDQDSGVECDATACADISTAILYDGRPENEKPLLQALLLTAKLLYENSRHCIIKRHGGDPEDIPGWLLDCQKYIRAAELTLGDIRAANWPEEFATVVRDPTPPHRRSPLEHERDAGEDG